MQAAAPAILVLTTADDRVQQQQCEQAPLVSAPDEVSQWSPPVLELAVGVLDERLRDRGEGPPGAFHQERARLGGRRRIVAAVVIAGSLLAHAPLIAEQQQLIQVGTRPLNCRVGGCMRDHAMTVRGPVQGLVTWLRPAAGRGRLIEVQQRRHSAGWRLANNRSTQNSMNRRLPAWRGRLSVHLRIDRLDGC